MMTKQFVIMAIGIWFLCVMPGAAYGYLDPGTGSMILQAFIAALAAGGIFLGMSWNRFRAFFRRKFPRKKPHEQESPHDH